MADLNNLLDEINNASEDEDTPQTYIAPQDAPPTRSTIPAALTAAADQRTTDALKPQTADRDDNNDQEETHLPDPEYEQLKSLWSQELSSPELLPADAETVSLHVDLLEGQEETIDHLLEQSKESRGSNASGGEATGELASLMAQITKMDLDRTRYMLVDLARTRMAKIENFALHNKSLVERMTDEEVCVCVCVCGIIDLSEFDAEFLSLSCVNPKFNSIQHPNSHTLNTPGKLPPSIR
jgi:hypothetical protein